MIIERKYFYAGEFKEYLCQSVLYDSEEGLFIIKYIMKNDLYFHGIDLKKGDISYGFFWIDKPYVIYEWFDSNGNLLCIYINVANDITFLIDKICWKDLIIDILLYPDGKFIVLDEDELLATNNPELIDKVIEIKEDILSNLNVILSKIKDWNYKIKEWNYK